MHPNKNPVRTATREALLDRLAEFDPVVEVGVGDRPAVARGLASRGIDVTVTDVRDCRLPGLDFVRDDVFDPELAVYEDAEALYALNLPPDLHGAVARLGGRIDSAVFFTTLGADPATVPVRRERLPGETLFVHDAQRA